MKTPVPGVLVYARGTTCGLAIGVHDGDGVTDGVGVGVAGVAVGVGVGVGLAQVVGM